MESSVLSNIDIGSKLKPVSFAKLEQDMSHDTAFHRFRVKFSVFITQFLTAHEYNLPNRKPLRFEGTDTVCSSLSRRPLDLMKVDFAISVPQGPL
jgi:hypothetical protein